MLSTSPAQADTVAAAVAANFSAPMQAIAPLFAQATGHEAQLSFGATGKFYAQINNGAPFDVLLSADSSTPSKLAAEKAAVAASQITYAQGQLLLWSAQPGYVDGAGAVLKTGTWKHLALANPKLAPYGAAGQVRHPAAHTDPALPAVPCRWWGHPTRQVPAAG